ncbi:hypothetical protein Tco_1358615 [Tanacetum coccineum]
MFILVPYFLLLPLLDVDTGDQRAHTGYADHIHELMAVSRELSPKDVPSLQKRGSKNYITQADYIEFDGVKVVTPSGNVLVEDLTLKVESGSNLLITGAHMFWNIFTAEMNICTCTGMATSLSYDSI